MSGTYNTFIQFYVIKDEAFKKIIVEAQKSFLPITKDPVA